MTWKMRTYIIKKAKQVATPRGCAVAPMIRPDVADELAIPPGGASSELTAV